MYEFSDCSDSKEAYIHSKETYIHSKEAYILGPFMERYQIDLYSLKRKLYTFKKANILGPFVKRY